MVRAALIGVLIAVGSFIGGLVLLTVSVVAIVGVEESDPAAVASAPVPAATREAPPQEPVPTTADEPADDEAAELQAADKEATEARRAERAEARAEEGKRIAAEKRAAQEEAAQEAAEKKAAEEAAERRAAEEAAEKKAAEEAAEKAAAEKKAEEDAAEKEASAGELVTVVAIVDGDTVDVSTGARIRIAGIDTPERGECGYEEAGARMMELARDREAVMVKAGADSIDRYGRLIRYLDVDGRDVGLTLIQEGLAIARYDSRDGYGWHDREAEYVAADAATAQAYSCAAPSAPQPFVPQPAPQPAPQPPAGGATDPQFGTCKEAKANGYGPYVVGVDPEYHWYRDADSDGIVCER